MSGTTTLKINKPSINLETNSNLLAQKFENTLKVKPNSAGSVDRVVSGFTKSDARVKSMQSLLNLVNGRENSLIDATNGEKVNKNNIMGKEFVLSGAGYNFWLRKDNNDDIINLFAHVSPSRYRDKNISHIYNITIDEYSTKIDYERRYEIPGKTGPGSSRRISSGSLRVDGSIIFSKDMNNLQVETPEGKILLKSLIDKDIKQRSNSNTYRMDANQSDRGFAAAVMRGYDFRYKQEQEAERKAKECRFTNPFACFSKFWK